MSDANQLRQRADELRAAAQQLQANALLGIRQTTGGHVWQGPPAEQFDSDLRRHEQTLRAAVDAIQAAAQRLQTQADQLDQANPTP